MNHQLTEDRRKYIQQDYSRGFIAFCGMEAVLVEPGRVDARLRIRPEHRQQDGFTHAGVMATIADHTAGYAAYTLVPEDHRILTIEFKINMLRPVVGEEILCRGQVIKPGRRILVCESEVFDQRPDGSVLAAKAQLTMASVHQDELKR